MPTVSYHLTPATPSQPWLYAKCFKTADIEDYERLSRCINGFVWSGIVWKEGARRQDAFDFADWCVLDFDSGEMSLAEASKLFCDMTHIIGTTKSHQVEKAGYACDRFRVAIRFERRITSSRDYVYTMKQLIDHYPIDAQATDAARYFFPCKNIVSINDDGYVQKVEEAPENWGRPNYERFALYTRTGVMPSLARWALSYPVPIGKRNKTWFRITKDLLRIGMSPDEILARIAVSPTYKGRGLEKNVPGTVESAVKAVAMEDAEHGRSEA